MYHVYSESRGEHFCEDASGVPLLVFFHVKPRSHRMGVGRIEKGDFEIDRMSVLNSGSRQCTVEIYIFRTQLVSKKTSSTRYSGEGSVVGEGHVGSERRCRYEFKDTWVQF